jgi:hypothetical protein
MFYDEIFKTASLMHDTAEKLQSTIDLLNSKQARRDCGVWSCFILGRCMNVHV